MMVHLSAILALLLSQAVVSPAAPCMPRFDLDKLAVLALPELVDTLSQRCTPHIPETAWLRTHGSQFVQRWRSDGRRDRAATLAEWARWRTAIRAQASGEPQPSQTIQQAEQDLVEMVGGFAAGMSKNLNPKACAELSRLVENLSQLPPQTVSQMVSSAVGFGVAMLPQSSEDDLPVCPS